MIGRLERVDLRDVWPHEARDLTRWLEGNPDVLSEAIDCDIATLQAEAEAGSFSADLRGEDSEGRVIVVENQLEKSDHKHLGQLVTYVAAFDAAVAVWICAEPRPEHTAAVTWLNEKGTAKFYLLKIEAVKIGESAPAPLLTLITGPSEEITQQGAEKRAEAGRFGERRSFWEAILEKLKPACPAFAGVSPSARNYLWTGAGVTGVGYSIRVLQAETSVEVYITRKDRGENERIYKALEARRDGIEAAHGGPLEWDPMPGQMAFRIRHSIAGGGYRSAPEQWPAIAARIADAMSRLERAMRKPLDEAARAIRS
jgi:Domain of unknown function (DUF4268)